MLLKVVALTTNVGGDLHTVGEAHTSDLTKGGVRLLGRRGVHAGAHAALLRAALECGRRSLLACLDSTLSNELVDGRHDFLEKRCTSGRGPVYGPPVYGIRD